MTAKAIPSCMAVLCSLLPVTASAGRRQEAPQPIDASATHWQGVQAGPYAVGFEVRKGTDPTRRINGEDGGTRIGLAIWYPARGEKGAASAVSTLDYRLLEFFQPPPAAERQLYEENALEGAGDTAGAAESATACAGKQAGNDWRASVALLQCKERLERLTSR